MDHSTARLICSEIRVRELERSLRFYRTLGLRPVARTTMENGERLAWLGDPITRQLVELYQVPEGSPLYEPFPEPGRFSTPLLFSTRNIGPLITRLRRRGAKLKVRFDEHDVQIAFLTDPDGTLVEIVGWTREARGTHHEPPMIGLIRRVGTRPPRAGRSGHRRVARKDRRSTARRARRAGGRR